MLFFLFGFKSKPRLTVEAPKAVTDYGVKISNNNNFLFDLLLDQDCNFMVNLVSGWLCLKGLVLLHKLNSDY